MHKLLLDIPTEFETDRLVVKRYERGDGKHIFDLLERNNNRELLKEEVDEATDLRTEEDAEINAREHAAEWEARERFVMGIWLKEKGLHIGQIWIEPKMWEVPSFELGYFLDTGFLGKGLATEAAKGSVDFIFRRLNAHKVIITTRDSNERSWKLAERIGFLREGHHRECSIKDDKRWGLYHYGLLESEYV